MTTITCPSGLAGEVRHLTGRDLRAITNVENDDEIQDYVLSNCWRTTVDDGPYAFGGKPIDWSKVLLGDRFYALISVREATWPGEPYPLTLRHCKNKPAFGWDVDLKLLLEKKTRKLKDADLEIFKNGNKFSEKIPFDGRAFAFRLQTGADSKRLAARIASKKTGTKEQQASLNMLVESIASYITTIDGVADKRDARIEALEDLSLKSIDALLPLIQSHDCGVDTAIDVRCPHCGGVFEIDLPFDKSFFMPATTTAIRQRKEATEPATDDDDEKGDSES